MDFIDSYSYGYDQVNVNPVRHVNYDNTEFTLLRNNLRDPLTKNMHRIASERKKYEDFRSNPPAYSMLGMQQHHERRKIKENIEDILRPYSRNTCKDDVKDRIAVQNNDLRELENIIKSQKECCKDCRLAKECDKCTHAAAHKAAHSHQNWFGETSETNMFLFILVVILAAFCVIQYVNTQTINATLLGMINRQPGGPEWLKSKKIKPSESPYVEAHE